MELSKEYLNAIKQDNAEKIVGLLRESGLADNKFFCEGIFLRAAQYGKTKIIKSMVNDMNVDINAEDHHGRSALDKVARAEHNKEAIEFLLNNGIKVHKSLLTDKRAKLDEDTKNILTRAYNKQREEMKIQLQEKGPQVDFTIDRESGAVSRADVVFQGLDDSMRVSFMFDRPSLYDLDLVVCINGKIVDRHVIDTDSYASIVDSHVKKGIIPYLKVKFKGNVESLNNVVNEAHKAVLKKLPEVKNALHAQRAKQDAQRAKQEQERLRRADEMGQRLQDKYGFLFENAETLKKDVEKKKEKILENKKKTKVNSKLSTLRKKIARDVDETLGTHLEEKKLPKPLKKVEKVVSDKFFGEVKE